MKMKKCVACSLYTLKDICPKCGGKTINPQPPKFSPEDKYGKYRRAANTDVRQIQTCGKSLIKT